jgi:hypothetical protein
MEAADETSNAILRNLVSTYSSRPHDILELKELFDSGVASTDPAYRELRNIFNQDWYEPDPQKSHLRQLVNEIQQQPRRFLGGFSDYIEQSKADKRAARVRELAEFCMVASQDDQMGIRTVLERSYGNWDRFDDLTLCFRGYVKAKTFEVERAINEIAGAPKKRSIRTPRSREEYLRYVKNLSIDLVNHPADVKAAKRARVQSSTRILPETVDIHEEASAELEPIPRKVHIAKTTQQKRLVELTTVETTKVAEKMNPRADQLLKDDIKLMIEYLQKRPLGQAVIKLTGIPKIIVDGKQLPLYRFAPNDAPGLLKNSKHRYHRIVFAFDKDNIIIVDSLDHDSFDKKYMS